MVCGLSSLNKLKVTRKNGTVESYTYKESSIFEAGWLCCFCIIQAKQRI